MPCLFGHEVIDHDERQWKRLRDRIGFGAAVGAALGLLFAPKPGSATRRDLAKSADDLRRRGMKLYDKAADTAADVSDAVSDLADRGAEFVDDATQQFKAGYKAGDLS